MISIDATRRYFDKYVATWNPCDTHHMNITIHRALHEDPSLLDTSEIFNSNPPKVHNDNSYSLKYTTSQHEDICRTLYYSHV